MAFTKFVNFSSAFTQAIFNEAHGAMWATNGRLSGFYPDAIGGDAGTLGITSIPVGGDTQRTITVDLKAPAVADDLRFSSAGQTTSFCLANGVLLKSDASVVLSVTMLDAGSPPLTSLDRIVIYAEYDDNQANPPTFSAARESAVDAAAPGVPIKKAKLAFFDPISFVWEPMPQISVGGIFQTSVDVNSKYGGLLATKLDSGTLKVTPGTIVGSFGRITSSGIRLVPALTFPAKGTFRKDVLVIYDQQSSVSELLQPPIFTIIKGSRESASVTVAEPVPAILDPRQVPLAEVMMSDTGIAQAIDIRPIMAWQTDSMMQSAPLALKKIDINTVQPGFIATDTTQGANVGWGLAVFRAMPDGVAGKSSMAVGLVGPPMSVTGLTTAGPGPFVPSTTTIPPFQPVPWVLEDSFQVLSGATDVTKNSLYDIKFDFKNGIFVSTGIIAQGAETFSVNFRQLQAIFVIDEDGRVHVPAIDAFFRHIAVDNPAAHVAFNVVYNNFAPGVPQLPGHPTDPTVSVQAAIEALARGAVITTASALILESWRFHNETVPLVQNNVGPVKYSLYFIGPSGYITAYITPVPTTPVDALDDGIQFTQTGKVIGYTYSIRASASGLGSIWNFALWSGNTNLPFTVTTSGGAAKASVLFAVPLSISSGQFMRLSLEQPSNGALLTTTVMDLRLSLDFIVQLN